MEKTVNLSDLIHFFPRQLEVTKAADTHLYTLYGGSAGPGKAQSIESIVYTPTGAKKMGKLRIGDVVSNPDGGCSRIIAIHPQGIQELFEIKFSDGATTTATKEHLWLAWEASKKSKQEKRHIKKGTIWTTEMIIQALEKDKHILIPLSEPVKFTRPNRKGNIENLIDPYLVGLLLGDGCLVSTGVSITTADEQIINYLRNSFTVKKWKSKYTYGISGIRQQLKSLKILGLKSVDKFIPKRYFIANIPTRLALLQGLMDTDGYSAGRDGSVYFYSISEKLAKGVQYLVRSLGGRAFISIKKGKYKKDNIVIECQDCFAVHIQMKLPPFRLLRKLKNIKKYNDGMSELSRRFVSITSIGKHEVQCITVNHPNGLYLTDDFIVTHNSYWLRWYPIRQMIKWGKMYNLRGIRGALFSKDFSTLKDRQISKMDVEFPKWLGEIKDSKTHGLGFHLRQSFGGHVLALRNLDDPSKYLSSEFAIIAQEEVTETDENTFNRVRSRLRWTGIERPQWIGATNPGGRGHAWVKKLWIDRVYPSELQSLQDEFVCVRALPSDNPYLAESYKLTLQSLPENLRRAYWEGNWDVFEGQFFTEWNREKHVVKPFIIPASWTLLRSIDPSGRSGITSCHWYAIDHDGRVYIYREYYQAGKDSDEHAKNILRLSGDENYRYTTIDTAAFSKLGMPETTSEIYERYGVTGLIPSMKNRIMGWDIVHQYLRWDEKNEPKLKVFENCVNFIRTIPLLIHDERHPEDVNSLGEDHCVDELRYILQTLREQKTPKPLTLIQKRLQELQEQQEFVETFY